MRELGIYIHIPFCKQKCYYCDFISFAKNDNKIEDYIEAIKKEILQISKMVDYKDNIVTTIYIGGGTPSYINEKHIEEILSLILQNYNVKKENVEITLEVNPGTVDREKLLKYKMIGINRLSIGLQSTNNKLLKDIGRIHTYEEFKECYKTAQEVGFKNINVDLIIGLPNQTVDNVKQSVNEIIKLNPSHISVYSLIVEENTKIEKMINEGILQLPDEETERKMYWETKRILEENQYIHYEISNFSKESYESKHNVNCWLQKEYLGFGLAAHSYYNNTRYCNIDNLENYCKNIQENNYDKNIVICEEQTEEEKKKEYMLLGLRKMQGVSIQEFKNKFIDNPIYLYRKELEKLVKEELIEIDLDYIRLTDKGLDLANIVWKEFV